MPFKFLFRTTLFCALTFLTLQPEAQAQRREEKSTGSRLWYGIGPILGFNPFAIGVSPMAGYKFTPWLSAGPRTSITFSSVKFVGARPINLFDTQLGIFLRGKVFRGLFLQGELGSERNQYVVSTAPNQYEKRNYNRFNQLLGAGWNSGGGGGWGSEFGIFYNFAIANDLNSSEQPIEYRFSFTYNF